MCIHTKHTLEEYGYLSDLFDINKYYFKDDFFKHVVQEDNKILQDILK